MFSSSSNHNPNGHYELPQTPNEMISCIEWSPTQDVLFAGSWDKGVYVWQVQKQTMQKVNFQAAAVAKTGFPQPILDLSINKDNVAFVGCCDNGAYMWNPQQQGSNPQQVAKHEAPVKSVEWSEGIQSLVTGSWDKTMKYWDIRQGKLSLSVNLPERVYAMRIREEMAVVATADNQVLVFDIRNPQQPSLILPSPLKYQIRAVAIDVDKSGFSVGSIEGRVAVHVFKETFEAKSFAFRCHRLQNDVYAINSLDYHPQFNTLATCGADGAFHIWDKISKQRLGKFKECSKPITAGRFNRDGSIFAYAVSYDWSKGYEYYKKDDKSYIMLHAPKPDEVAPKKK